MTLADGAWDRLPAMAARAFPRKLRGRIDIEVREAAPTAGQGHVPHARDAQALLILGTGRAPGAPEDPGPVGFPFVAGGAAKTVTRLGAQIGVGEALAARPSGRRYASRRAWCAHRAHQAPRSTSAPVVAHSCPAAQRKR